MQQYKQIQLARDLAQRQTDEAAKKIALMQAEIHKQQYTLQQLTDYHTTTSDNAINKSRHCLVQNNNHLFLNNINQAIIAQNQVLKNMQYQLQQLQENWRQKTLRVQSLSEVIQQLLTIQKNSENRREQRDNDEIAARQFVQRRNNSS